MRKITQEEFNNIVKAHQEWLKDSSKGSRANFDNCDLSEIQFIENLDLSRASFFNADLYNVHFVSVNLFLADFSGARLNLVSFLKSNLSHCTFINADMYSATICDSFLDGSKFMDGRLVSVEIIRCSSVDCRYDDANLSYSTIDSVIFDKSMLETANFNYSTIDDSNFCSCFLKNATFCETRLTNVNFTYSDLTWAEFIKAEIWSTNFARTVLNCTDLSTTECLYHCSFTGAETVQPIYQVSCCNSEHNRTITLIANGDRKDWKWIYDDVTSTEEELLEDAKYAENPKYGQCIKAAIDYLILLTEFDKDYSANE